MMKKLTMREAIREAIREEMLRDESVFVMGEGAYTGGGMWSTLGDMGAEFGPQRIMNAPLSETVIAGSAVGAALAGLRPIAEIMFSDFAFICADEIMQKMGKWRYQHGAQGGMTLPIVVRMTIGGAEFGLGGEHSATPLAYFMHTPCLKVVVPSTAYDAKGLLKTAIRDNNPVMFFEHKVGYRTESEVPEGEYTIPFGVADVKREGSDVTVVAIGMPVQYALKMAEEAEKEGVSVEVIDPRTLVPLDMDAILKSVLKTGRVVLADEDNETCGSMAEIATQIYEKAWGQLKGPIKRVCAKDVPIPVSPPMARAVAPQPEWIAEAIREVMAY